MEKTLEQFIEAKCKEFEEEFYIKEFGIKCSVHSPCDGFECIKSFLRQALTECSQATADTIREETIGMIKHKILVYNLTGVNQVMAILNQWDNIYPPHRI